MTTPRDISGDWPSFADEQRLPGHGFWLVLLASAFLSAVGFGWMILWWLA